MAIHSWSLGTIVSSDYSLGTKVHRYIAQFRQVLHTVHSVVSQPNLLSIHRTAAVK